MPRGVRDQGRVVRQRLIIELTLRRAERKGWDRRYTATVLQAQLTPSRITYGVTGPCFYCGADAASSVDHLEPLAGGGADDRTNVVSACWPCNDLKGDRPLRAFLYMFPFGSDYERSRRYGRPRYYYPDEDLPAPRIVIETDPTVDLANPNRRRRAA